MVYYVVQVKIQKEDDVDEVKEVLNAYYEKGLDDGFQTAIEVLRAKYFNPESIKLTADNWADWIEVHREENK